MADLNDHIEAIATAVLNLQPDRKKSTKTELHYDTGTYGTKVCVAGPKRGKFFDHDLNEGGDGWKMLQIHKGLVNGEAVTWLRENGIEVGSEPQTDQRIVATYDYTDETGKLLFQVVRYSPKRFVQRRRADDGKWIWGLKAGKYWLGKTGWKLDKGDSPSGAEVRHFPECQKVPYRLPELLTAVAEGSTIRIVEGEKDVESLRRLGLPATCNPGGKLKWSKEFSRYFAGARVAAIPDKDADGGGLRHAQDVVAKLKDVAASVIVTAYVDVGKDVSEWIEKGADRKAIERLDEGAGHIDASAEPSLKSKPAFTKEEADLSDIAGFELHEDGLAMAFAEKYRDKLRYCHTRGSWYHWTGAYWELEKTSLAFSWARELCRQFYRSQENLKVRNFIAKASTAAAVERFARSDRVFAVTSDAWDKNPFLLGTPGGVVDLRTGILRPADPSDNISKVTAVAPAPVLHDDHPTWTQFLDDATRGDAKLQRFLQQMVGYSLTGDVSEECLFFVHGPGGNGKGVFLRTVGAIMGDYATSAAMDTFTASKSDKHPTDLAKLAGSRMVTASETEEGRAWAESRIKELTGNERPISARFMRQDFFEYQAQFKLLIVGNHRPILNNVDDAMRRRFNIIPFTNKPTNKDSKLKEKLEEEYPAILRWMIDGCLDWQKNGLIRPTSVLDATKEYFDSQDVFGQWVRECCEIKPGDKDVWERSADLYESWVRYCAGHGEESGKERDLGTKLTKIEVGKMSKRVLGVVTAVRTGIRLTRNQEADEGEGDL